MRLRLDVLFSVSLRVSVCANSVLVVVIEDYLLMTNNFDA